MKKAITLQYLTTLSKARKKTRQTDPSINGLVWRISETGTVSAAYRIYIPLGNHKKDTVKVFRANMQLNSTAFTEVRKKAMELELRVIEGKSPFEEQEKAVEVPRYTIGQYYVIFRKDRPVELSVRHRKKKRVRSVGRDISTIAWLFSREIEGGTATQPRLFSDLFIDDDRVPSYLDRIIAQTTLSGVGLGNMEKGLVILRQLYQNARRNKVIADNPLEDFHWTAPPSKRAKDIPLNALSLITTECRKYARGEGNYKNRKWKRLGLMFEFKMLMGNRVNEASNLRKDWIDFSTNTITIPEDDTKSEREYRFAFPNDVAELLKRSPAWDEPHNNLVFGIDNKACGSYDKEWHVILDGTGVMGDVSILEQKKKRMQHQGQDVTGINAEIKELKLSRYRGHDTRHAFATDQMRSAVTNGLVMSERDESDVLKQIGKGLQHSDIKTTKHYVRPDDEIQRQMVANRQKALNQVLGSTE